MNHRVLFKSAIAFLAIALAALAIKPPVEPAPRFHATSMDGEKFSNDSLKGKVVLLQFWATWCKFCRGDQSVVDDVTQQFAERGLVVLAVNVMESKKTVKKYLAEMPRACKIVLTEDTNLAALYAAKSFPLYVLIDRDGNVAGTQKGAGGERALRQLLRKAGIE
jgi:thiol-disulfide isomerase/thioredoxin